MQTSSAQTPLERAALPCAVRAALAAYRAAVVSAFGERLADVRLFGSYARGEAHAESGVDVFVTIADLTHADRNLAFDLAYEVQLHGEWVGLAPLPYSIAQAAELRDRERRLLLDVYSEGIPL